MSAIWSGDRAKVRQTAIGGGVIVAAGIALIILGVIQNWGPTRLPGALLISAGAAAAGVAVGLSQSVRTGIWARLAAWRVWIAVACAVVIVTPVLLAMGSATFGPVAGGGDAKDTALVAVGVFFGLVFTVGTALAAILSVFATRNRVSSARATNSHSTDAEDVA